jgi:hypothetical protein
MIRWRPAHFTPAEAPNGARRKCGEPSPAEAGRWRLKAFSGHRKRTLA